MVSIYLIAVWWSIWVIWAGIATLRLAHKSEVKARHYTQYQSSQQRQANQRLIEIASARALQVAQTGPITGLTITIPEGSHAVITSSSGQQSVVSGNAGQTGAPVGVSATTRRRRTTTTKPRVRKKKGPTPELATQVPISPEDAFYDDLRME